MQELLKRAAKAISAVNKEYDADVYLFSGAISGANYGRLVTAVSAPRKHKNALVIVATNGGFANAGFKIARLLQGRYGGYTLYVPRECYSAGTLLALGANRLILDQFAELGPLDVQLQKPNEIGGRKSGLVSRSAFESLGEIGFTLFESMMLKIKGKSGGAVTFDVAAQLAAQLAAALVAPVTAKIDPDVIGSDYRDLNVATEYGNRLAETGQNVEPGAVERLVSAYPAHDFIIDQLEAHTLFKRIERPSGALYALVGEVVDSAFTEARPAVILRLEKPDAPRKKAATAKRRQGAKKARRLPQPNG